MKFDVFMTTLVTILLSITFMKAQDTANPLETQSISVFKNGSAFFIKKGTVKTKEGEYVISEDLPRALFGTFWIHSPDNDLNHVSSYADFVKKKRETMATSFLELMDANKDKKMKVHIGEDEVYTGRVEQVKMNNEKGDPVELMNKSVVVFNTGSAWLSFSPSEVRRVEFLEKPEQIVVSENMERKNVLHIDFKSKKSEQPLEMMYLQNGLNWTPTYLIELVAEDKAKLELRAEISNDAEDIEDTDVSFVVGIPNFRFATRLSSLVEFLGMIASHNPGMMNNFSNAIQAQTLNYEIEESLDGDGWGDMGGGVQGTSDEDLFFYKIKDLTLKKGGRGQYPIFNIEVGIQHIYESNIEANTPNRGYYKKEFLYVPDNRNPVFHSIKLENNTKFPWTTGAAMVVSKKAGETRPISQDQLNYTPIKGKSYVKLTESPDIKIKHAEKEINRMEKDRKMAGTTHRYWDLVTVEGKVKVKSYKDKKVDLNIKRAITGDLLKSSVKWLTAERINRSGNINKVTDVCWETSIDPGEEIEITYTYKVFVPYN